MTIYDGERRPIFLEEDGGWKKAREESKTVRAREIHKRVDLRYVCFRRLGKEHLVLCTQRKNILFSNVEFPKKMASFAFLIPE